MKNKTQREIVIDKLLLQGYITRNQCLQMNITRLGAIICDLEQKEGWMFDARYGTKNKKDYGYVIVKCPLHKSTYKIGDKIITTWKKEH
jgi:membrane carboxypeptidase/penicillin-binding protein